MEEESYIQRVNSVHRLNLPRTSSCPVPYLRRPISSPSPSYQLETLRETNTSFGSNVNWATDDLKISFTDVYRKHGSLQQRRALNIKYKHIVCSLPFLSYAGILSLNHTNRDVSDVQPKELTVRLAIRLYVADSVLHLSNVLGQRSLNNFRSCI